MGTINKKQKVLISLLMGIGLLFLLIHYTQKSLGPMIFIAILPSEVDKNRDTDSLLFREDYFAIMNLDRSDSAALLHAVAQHTCQVTDSINLRKYHNYRIEYYEHGIYMNESTSHRRDRPLYHVANEIDAFVYWIIYHNGDLNSIKWFKTGEVDRQKEITVTEEVKQLFTKCHQPK